MDIFSNIALGLATALSVTNLLYCLLGVTLGMIVGVVPGIGIMATMSMLFPLTFYLEPTTALIMLAGIWYGSAYGGSTASILLNIPGTPANAVTCLDGYPMARQGRAALALFMTTVASFVGGSFGILVLMLFSPLVVGVAVNFGAPEYFSLMLLGLVAASVIADQSMMKGLAMIVLGITMGTVGLDIYTGSPRFTFGVLNLMEGISLVALAMGLFGVAEVIASVRRIKVGDIDSKSITFRAMLPSRDEMRRSWFPMARGSAVGAFFGILPGTGSSVASFMAYALEKRVSREPSRFGKGAIEGIMGPESSNNAAEQTSFVPTLTLGIPGSPTMALMLGALMIHGITPGPNLMLERPDMFWGLVMSFWIGNLILLVLNIPLIGIWVRLLLIPYHLLYPAILVFICVGTYSVSQASFDVWLVVFIGFLGYVMRVLTFPAAPFLLGFVLGPLLEEHFRRAMLISRGNLSTFLDRPISATFLAITAALVLWGIWNVYAESRSARLAREKAGGASPL